jgi:translation initiation factor 5B
MRSPICAFLGHVDAGKTSIMDSIRNTFFAYRESGGLTQNIGITEVPTKRIKEISSDLLEKFKVDVKMPSIIFIDSPGHEAFVTLRERGASIADLAILTIDIREGIQNQTIESIEILKSYKTPFLIALTKIDTIQSFTTMKNASFLELNNKQGRVYLEYLDKRIYEIITDLSNYGFQAERYDRVNDFTKEVAVIPVSAINGIGIKDLMVMIIGLSQRYIGLEKSSGNAAALIEEKTIKGIGAAYDAIVYSGEIKVGDRIVMQTKDGPAESKLRGIMKLIALEESRENFGKYESVKSASEATPVRLLIQDPIAMIGTSIEVFTNEEEKKQLMTEIEKSNSGYNDDSAKGTVVCADSVGSLDAIKKIGATNNIKIGKTKIGEPSKSDIMTGKINGGAVLCFNVSVQKAIESLAKSEGVTIIATKSIYDLFERYSTFMRETSKQELEAQTANIKLPAKLVFLRGDVFRKSNPCVFGIEVLGGEIRPGYPLIKKNGERLGRILEIQGDKKKLEYAKMGDKVAISVDCAIYGRNLKDEEILYSDIEIQDIIKINDILELLTPDYLRALTEIQKIKHI